MNLDSLSLKVPEVSLEPKKNRVIKMRLVFKVILFLLLINPFKSQGEEGLLELAQSNNLNSFNKLKKLLDGKNDIDLNNTDILSRSALFYIICNADSLKEKILRTELISQQNKESKEEKFGNTKQDNHEDFFKNLETETRNLLQNSRQKSEKVLLDVVKSMIIKGANVNQEDYLSNSLLMKAVECKQYGISCTLIKHGADVNAVNKKGKTPLFYAIECNSLPLVCLLLVNGAEIEVEKHSALICAVNSGANEEIIRRLIRKKADLNFKEHGKTALEILSEKYRKSFNILKDNIDAKGTQKQIPTIDQNEKK